MAPRVSVIVPVFNLEEHLDRFLESLADQTLRDIEFIIVNDGSTDRSQEIIDTFTESDPVRFRSFIQPNAGPSVARNFALGQATGEYVGFADGDDWLEPEMFEQMAQTAERSGADVVVCGYMTVDSHSGERKYHRQGFSHEYGRSLIENPAVLRAMAPFVWNKIFRRQLIVDTDIRFPEGLLLADIPFTYSALLHANRIEKVQKPLYHYSYHRPGSITHTYSPRKLEMFQTLAILNDYYRSHEAHEDLYIWLMRLNLKHIYYRFIELPSYNGIAVKQRFVTLYRAHLERYFPDWRDHLEWLEKRAEPWRLPFMHYAGLARVYALFPRRLHTALDWVGERRAAAITFVRRFSSERRVRLRYLRVLQRELVDPETALFETCGGAVPGGSPLWLMKELTGRKTHTVYFGTEVPAQAQAALDRRGIDATAVRKGSAQYTQLLATAGLIVSDAPMPTYFVKRPGQTYLNTLQGTSLRRHGRGVKGGLRRMSVTQGDMIKTDYLLAASETAAACVMDDYMLEVQYGGTVLVMPLPGCEVLGDDQVRATLRQSLGITDMYVGVFTESAAVLDSRTDLTSLAGQYEDRISEIDDALPDTGVVVFVRPPTTIAGSVDFSRFSNVRLAPDELDRFELLAVADCLITDYSEALVEFASTGREIVLLIDSEGIGVRAPSLHVANDEMPVEVLTSARDAGVHLARQRPFEPSARFLRFRERFPSPVVTSASADVLDVVLGQSEPRAYKRENRPVDIVFIPYLKKKGRAVFEELLTSGYARDDVVFVMSGHQYRAAASAYLHELYAERGMDIAYRVTSDRILLTLVTATMTWLQRRFGWHFSALDRAYLMEARRLFGTTRVRSAVDFSGYEKFSEMARVVDEHANSEAF